MVDYTAPAEYPYVDLPTTTTPVYAAALNAIVAQLTDLAAATTGRVPVLEATAAAQALSFPDVFDGFVGADAAAPDTAKWSRTVGAGAGARGEILTNRLRLTAGATGGYSGNDLVTVKSVGSFVDAELLFLLEYGDPAVEAYFSAGLRVSSASVLSTGTGYAVETSGFGTSDYIQINKYVAGVKTSLSYNTGFTFANGDKRWFRFRVSGTAITLKHWAYGTTEPASVTYSVTDSAISATGGTTFEISGGNAAASGSFYVHKAVIFDLAT